MPDRNDGTRDAALSGANDRLRRRIDSGMTGDKVCAQDPAAAPLGTDDEAAQGHDEDGLRIAREAGSRSAEERTERGRARLFRHGRV